MKWMEEYKRYFNYQNCFFERSTPTVNSAEIYSKPMFDQPEARLSIGGSVVALKFDDGIVMAADNMVSYGHLGRCHNAHRVVLIGDKIMMGAFGSYPDFQEIQRLATKNIDDCLFYNDGHQLGPDSMYAYLTNLMHVRRSSLKPYLVNVALGGIKTDGSIFLGTVDLQGTAFTSEDVLALGLGKMLVKNTLTEQVKSYGSIDEEMALSIIHHAMETLFYRDTHSMARYTVGILTPERAEITGPYDVNQNWTMAEKILGF